MPDPSAHGARRLLDHPLLGPLPPGEEAGFTFDGRSLTGRAGEPILAALLAAGVRVCRTMPHSGEARGGYCLVGRCTDCLMQVDGEPNVRTCLAPLRAGSRVATQHGLGAWGPAPGDGASGTEATGDGGAT